MQTNLLKSLAIILTLFSLSFVLTACHDEDDEMEDDEISELDPAVGESAYPILEDEGSLHIFTVEKFIQHDTADTDGNIYKDQMELTFDSFLPALSTEEPDIDDDENLSDNDLGYTQIYWYEESNEDNTALDDYPPRWKDRDPLSDSKFLNNDREYLIVSDGEISDIYDSNYRPLYEVIDEEIYERHQSVVFVWDFDDIDFASDTLESERDVSGDDLKDWERLFIYQGYDILPHASIWGEDDEFSQGATIYGATRSIAKNIVVIEAVKKNSNDNYSLSTARFHSGTDDIETWLGNNYPADGDAGSHLEYLFTVDFFTHHFLYMQFDTINKEVQLFTTNTTIPDNRITVEYSVNTEEKYIEIYTSSLAKTTLDGLNLPAYFNPVIAGPFGDDNDYYYGKRYIETDYDQRLKLEPVFFLNSTAKSDVETAFQEWRIERHEEEED